MAKLRPRRNNEEPASKTKVRSQRRGRIQSTVNAKPELQIEDVSKVHITRSVALKRSKLQAANAAEVKCIERPCNTPAVGFESMKLRKCKVRIRRLKLQAPYQHFATTVAGVNVKSYDAGNSLCTFEAERAMQDADAAEVKCTEESSGNTPIVSVTSMQLRKCKVRVRNIKLQAPCQHFGKTVVGVNVNSVDAGNNTTIFEPQRNSTMCVMATEADASFKVPKTVNKHPIASKTTIRAASQVSTNKMNTTTEQQASQTTQRFFHRDRKPLTRKTSITRNMYEFLSKSPEPDDNIADPAADIIEKLIKEGRACVMTRIKKTGQHRAKPVKRKVRPVGKRKQCSTKSLGSDQGSVGNQLDHNENMPQEVVESACPMSPIFEDNQSVEEAVELAQTSVQLQQRQAPLVSDDSKVSKLARSVLLNQVKCYTPKRRRELLDNARKFVSTPVVRKGATVQDAEQPTVSPIMAASSRKTTGGIVGSGGHSPWRVPDELALPNTFTFGLNTSLLPSYSSDHISRKSNLSSSVYVPDAKPTESHIVAESQNITVNDSNGENMPPPATIPIANSSVNENEENIVQLPNPRRMLSYRSPLKDINILDVVILPSWKKNPTNIEQNTPHKETNALTDPNRTTPNQSGKEKTAEVDNMFGFEKYLENAENTLNQSPQTDKTNLMFSPLNTSNSQREIRARKSSGELENLFGFEEFLNEEEIPTLTRKSVANKQSTLHKKLQQLKDLRPKNNELPQTDKTPMRYAYDDLTANEPKQRKIMDMLSSTMLTPAKKPEKEINNQLENLFNDDNPVTFDNKKPRRTYIQEKPKRKRKRYAEMRFVEISSSEDEQEEQDSLDKSNSPQRPMKRACTRKEKERAAKLEQYITSFNKECEEVQKFNMIIE